MERSSAAGPGVRRRTILGAVPALAAGYLAGCGAGEGYPGGILRIASGGEGGVYHAYAYGIAAVIRVALGRLDPVVLTTAGGVENLRLVSTDTAVLGFTTADVAADGYDGRTPFEQPLPVVALARIYESYLHLAVRQDCAVTGVGDLRGLRVSIGPVGSATAFVSTRLLSLAGLDPAHDMLASRLDPEPAAGAVAGGLLDAMFFCGGIPTAAIAVLATQTPIVLLDLSACVPALRKRFGEVYFERTIPASAYQVGGATATVGVPNDLVVHESMDERLAYLLTRAMFEHRDLLAAAHPEGRRLDRGAAIATSPLPLHPGAARYYRELKA